MTDEREARMRTWRGLAVAMMLASVATSALAQAVPMLRTPVEAVRAEQDRRADGIKQSVAVATDSTAGSDARVDAIHKLSGVGFDYLLPVAPELVKAEEPVALATVSTLGAAIAMLPAHDHEHGMEMTPYDTYQANLVQQVQQILRSALLAGAPAIQDEAAKVLASRGDEASLSIIQSLIDTGVFKQRTGIGYLTLAPSEKASPIIASYIDSEDLAAKAAAVTQLSYNPDYITQVREIVLTPGTSPEVVNGALDGLSRVDDQFLTYGLTIVENEALPQAVRETAFEATVRSTLVNPVDTSIAKAIEPSFRDAVKMLDKPAMEDALKQFVQNYDLQ